MKDSQTKQVEQPAKNEPTPELLETVKIALFYRDFGVLNEYLVSIGEKKIESPAQPTPVKGDDADKLIESAGEACMLIVGAYEGYQWERARSLELTASIMFEYAKAGYELSKAAPKGDDVESKELQDDPFIKKHLAIIRERTIDNIIEYNIAKKMWGSLEMASIHHFIETGTINGSFYLRLKEAMMTAYNWKEQPEYANQFKSAPQAVKWVQAEERLPVKEYNYFVKAWNFDMKSTYNGTAHFKNGKFIDERYTVYGNPVEVKVFEWLDEGSTDKNQTK